MGKPRKPQEFWPRKYDHYTGSVEVEPLPVFICLDAMDLSVKEAERFYLEKRDNAESNVERDLFDWLATWEHGHLELLASMDRALMEDIWFQNNFWPEI